MVLSIFVLHFAINYNCNRYSWYTSIDDDDDDDDDDFNDDDDQ